MIVNKAKEMLGYLMAIGSGTSYPRYCAVGTGSSTVTVNQSGLNSEATGVSRSDYTSLGSGTVNKITWTYDFNSVTMSGVSFKEFGLFDTSVSESGTMWNRESFGAVTFDGTNELQVQVTFEIF